MLASTVLGYRLIILRRYKDTNAQIAATIDHIKVVQFCSTTLKIIDIPDDISVKTA
jgi:hypothetical protein